MLRFFPHSRRTTKRTQTTYKHTRYVLKRQLQTREKTCTNHLGFREWKLTGEIREQLTDFIHLSFVRLGTQQAFNNFTIWLHSIIVQ